MQHFGHWIVCTLSPVSFSCFFLPFSSLHLPSEHCAHIQSTNSSLKQGLICICCCCKWVKNREGNWIEWVNSELGSKIKKTPVLLASPPKMLAQNDLFTVCYTVPLASNLPLLLFSARFVALLFPLFFCRTKLYKKNLKMQNHARKGGKGGEGGGGGKGEGIDGIDYPAPFFCWFCDSFILLFYHRCCCCCCLIWCRPFIHSFIFLLRLAQYAEWVSEWRHTFYYRFLQVLKFF